MRDLYRDNQRGLVPVLLLVAVIGIVTFVLIASSAPFQNQFLASFYPKDSSFAKSPYNDGDTDGDLDVDLFDYNNILTNFGKGFNNGDYNDNGSVDIFDLNLVLSNFQKKYTANPLASPAASTAVAMIEGVPVCTDHDITKWHALVKKDESGTIICTYGHEHHDDPNSVNDIFGPPGEWYGQSGQEISYPWQTYSFTTPAGVDLPMPSPPPANAGYLENNAKHNGYKWVVRRDVPCIPFRTGAPSDGCYRAMRVLFHTLGTTADVTVRFHSFSIEALVEQGGKQGIVRTGGWMDTGHLGLLVDGGSSLICPPVNTNPPTFTCPPAGRTDGNARNAYSTNVPSPHTPHANPGGPVNWYIRFRGIAAAQPHVQDFGPIDYADPAKQLFYPEKYKANNSAGGHENVFINTTFSWLTPFNQNGKINYSGYANRHGANVTGCTISSLDCVPVKVEGAPQAIFSAHPATDPTAFYDTDHDVVSPVTGKSLIVYPN